MLNKLLRRKISVASARWMLKSDEVLYVAPFNWMVTVEFGAKTEESISNTPWPPLSGLRAAGLLVLLSACWLLVNAPTEGRVLLALSAERGLTTADLVVLPPLGLALLLVVRAL